MKVFGSHKTRNRNEHKPHTEQSLMHILTNTIKPPAALPWTALPAISLAMLVAAHIAEPAKKSTIATSRASLR